MAFQVSIALSKQSKHVTIEWDVGSLGVAVCYPMFVDTVDKHSGWAL